MDEMGNVTNGTQQTISPLGIEKKKSGLGLRSVLRMLESQHHRCALTGRQLEPGNAAMDHKVPIDRGGEHCIENAQILRKEVNRAKHTMTNEEFVSLCYEVVQHYERKNESQTAG